MRLSRKGPVYQNAPREYRVMRAYGLPTRYWDVSVEDGRALSKHLRTIGFTRQYNNKVLQVPVPKQKALVDELLNDEAALRTSRIIGIGSVPTDELALALAAAIMRRACDLRLRPLCVSADQYPHDLAREPDVVVLHNIMPDCHAMRLQVCRDWLARFDDTLRIIVVAGADPYTFCHTRLFCPLDAAVYLEGELREDI